MRKVLKWGAIGFGGLLVILLVAGIIISIFDSGTDVSREETASAPTGVPSPTVAPKSTTVPTPTLSPTCTEPMDGELTTLLSEMQSCRPDLSHETKEAIRLFMELWSFKDDPEFHRVGLGACCKFDEWKQEVETLTNSAGTITLGEIGIVPGDLLSLGWDYFQNAGQPTEFTDATQDNMESAVRESMGLSAVQPTPAANPVLGYEIIGEWEGGNIPSRITIFNEAGQLNVKQVFYDGSELMQSLVESNSSAGRRFDTANEFGEYFVVDADGNLQVWDSSGLLYTAKKIE